MKEELFEGPMKNITQPFTNGNSPPCEAEITNPFRIFVEIRKPSRHAITTINKTISEVRTVTRARLIGKSENRPPTVSSKYQKRAKPCISFSFDHPGISAKPASATSTSAISTSAKSASAKSASATALLVRKKTLGWIQTHPKLQRLNSKRTRLSLNYSTAKVNSNAPTTFKEYVQKQQLLQLIEVRKKPANLSMNQNKENSFSTISRIPKQLNLLLETSGAPPIQMKARNQLRKIIALTAKTACCSTRHNCLVSLKHGQGSKALFNKHI